MLTVRLNLEIMATDQKKKSWDPNNNPFIQYTVLYCTVQELSTADAFLVPLWLTDIISRCRHKTHMGIVLRVAKVNIFQVQSSQVTNYR
jgi:hypothetical protein